MERISTIHTNIRLLDPTAPLSDDYLTSLRQYQVLKLSAEQATRQQLVLPDNPDRGCVSKEDFVGDNLVLDRNLVILILLEGRRPVLECYRWSELRALIEDPEKQESDRVHLWRQEGTPTNRVYQLGTAWYDPSWYL